MCVCVTIFCHGEVPKSSASHWVAYSTDPPFSDNSWKQQSFVRIPGCPKRNPRLSSPRQPLQQSGLVKELFLITVIILIHHSSLSYFTQCLHVLTTSSNDWSISPIDFSQSISHAFPGDFQWFQDDPLARPGRRRWNTCNGKNPWLGPRLGL